jgi:hypothetical protein
VGAFLCLAQQLLLAVAQGKQEMDQAVLLWAVLLVGLAVVGRVEILLAPGLLVIPPQQHRAKETMAVTELQTELLVLAVVEVELVLLVLMLLVPVLVMVEMVVQVQRQLLLAQVLIMLAVGAAAVGSALLELAESVAVAMAVGIT